MTRLSRALIVMAVLFAPATAGAQTPTFTADRFTMGGAPDDGFAVWRPALSERTRF